MIKAILTFITKLIPIFTWFTSDGRRDRNKKKAVEDNWVRVALANYAFKKGIENPQHVSHFPIACSALYRQLPLGYYPRLRELVDGQLAQTWELLSQQTFV